jgi:hypothetical protein
MYENIMGSVSFGIEGLENGSSSCWWFRDNEANIFCVEWLQATRKLKGRDIEMNHFQQ